MKVVITILAVFVNSLCFGQIEKVNVTVCKPRTEAAQIEKQTGLIKVESGLRVNMIDTSKALPSFRHCLSSTTKIQEPLLIVDGKRKAFGSLKNLNPDQILAITVLKDSEAVKKYVGKPNMELSLSN